jgi:hypothetical protein
VHRAIRKNVKARRWRRVNMVRADYHAGTLHQRYAQRQARKRAERLRAYFFSKQGVCTCNLPIPTCYHASPLCLATSPSAQGMKCHATRRPQLELARPEARRSSPDSRGARSPQGRRPPCPNPFLIVSVAIRNQRNSNTTKDARAF